jgi:hypothetical protein
MPNAPYSNATSLAPRPALLNASLMPAPVGDTKLHVHLLYYVHYESSSDAMKHSSVGSIHHDSHTVTSVVELNIFQQTVV